MGQLVTVVGTHAGVGTTSVAANLAAALAEGGRHPVRLVELDTELGHLAADLAVDPAGDVTDAATLAAGPGGPGGTTPSVESLLTPLAPGLTALLASTARPAGPTRIGSRLGGPATARLLDSVRAGADVVVDAPAVFEDRVVTALAMSDRVVVVTTPDAPAREALDLILESLALMQVPAERVSLVLNHAGAGGGPGGLDVEPVEGAAAPLVAVLPECVDLEAGAGLVAVDRPDHAFALALRRLVQTVRRPVGEASRPSAVSRLLGRRAR